MSMNIKALSADVKNKLKKKKVFKAQFASKRPKQVFAIYTSKISFQNMEVLLLQLIQMRCWLVLAKQSYQGFTRYKSCVKKLH